MDKAVIREMVRADACAVVALNKAVVRVTSPMDLDRFAELYELSHHKMVVEVDEQVVAFVLVVTHGQSYDNANYHWFGRRFEAYFYIDRVVVADEFRGRGLGSSLYSRINNLALKVGVSALCAEIDVDPPNVESLRFHQRAGFTPLGSRVLENGKQVSMQIRPIVAGLL